MVCEHSLSFRRGFPHCPPRELLSSYRPKMVSRSLHRKYPICNCVHSYPFSPCQTPFTKNMSFATITNPWRAPQLTKTVCTHGPGALLCAQVEGLDLVLWHRHRARILVRVCLKKEYVHIIAQRVPYSGTVSAHQV